MRSIVAAGSLVAVLVLGVVALSQASVDAQSASGPQANSSYNTTSGVIEPIAGAGGQLPLVAVAAVVMVALGFAASAARGAR